MPHHTRLNYFSDGPLEGRETATFQAQQRATP
jgi:hypothetical protein